MPFSGHLTVERLESGEWVLLSPFAYLSSKYNEVVTVPAGFTTDFASVPRLPLIFTVLGDKGHKAAVIHDYLYATKAGRAKADAIFKEALLESESGWRAYLMWFGVRIGGWWAYRS